MSLEQDITQIKEDLFKPASPDEIKKRYTKFHPVEFNEAMHEIFNKLEPLLPANVRTEYVESIILYLDVDPENATFKGDWIEIYAYHQGSQYLYNAIAVYLTPDHPFGEDKPYFVSTGLKDTDSIVKVVMKLVHEYLAESVNEQGEDIFTPATGEEIEQRKGEYAHQQYVAKKKRSEATRKRYASIQFTYDDIVHLRGYQQIMGLRDVEDITTPIQKQHKTTSFRLKWGNPPGSRRNYKDYIVYANGYVRAVGSTTFSSTAPLMKADPVENIEGYAALIDFLYPIMQRKWNKEHASELKRASQSEDLQKKEIALEILRMINYPIEDHWRYDSNLNYSEIKAIYDRLKG